MVTMKAIDRPSISSRQILSEIQTLLADDLEVTNQLITQQLVSDVPIIQTIAQHIIKSGGKRLRPLLVLLTAHYFGYQGSEHHELAAIIEFVHTATLLHDDVVDSSKLRRGQDTANQIWGNQVSVLVGDFLYSRAFQLLTQRSHIAVMKVLAHTTNAIAEGEVTQLVYRHDPTIDEKAYLEVIHRKTACLFSAAAQIGAILGNCSLEEQKILADYGLNLGMAFQIIDDLLDYTVNKSEMGKNKGDDLAEGRTTLPLIYAMKHADGKDTEVIRKAIQNGDLAQLDQIVHTLLTTQAQDYTISVATEHANKARAALNSLGASNNLYFQALDNLIDFVLIRHY
jgi:octaprenyl-diphosphate synthase